MTIFSYEHRLGVIAPTHLELRGNVVYYKYAGNEEWFFSPLPEGTHHLSVIEKVLRDNVKAEHELSHKLAGQVRELQIHLGEVEAVRDTLMHKLKNSEAQLQKTQEDLQTCGVELKKREQELKNTLGYLRACDSRADAAEKNAAEHENQAIECLQEIKVLRGKLNALEESTKINLLADDFLQISLPSDCPQEVVDRYMEYAKSFLEYCRGVCLKRGDVVLSVEPPEVGKPNSATTPAIPCDWLVIMELAHDTFKEYAEIHAAKGTADGYRKAARNQQMVEAIAQLLRGVK